MELGLQHLRQAYTLGGQQGDAGVVAGAWNNIGLALQRTGGRDPDMLRRAAEAYGESLKAMPGQPEARYNLGRLRETQVRTTGTGHGRARKLHTCVAPSTTP